MPRLRRRAGAQARKHPRSLTRSEASTSSPINLLFDENLAEHLVRDLADLYPGSAHVRGLGLGGADDRGIWDRAAADGLVLVSKDEDFHRFSVLLGPPPKVVWIRLGNCRTSEVSDLLRRHAADVHAFANQEEATFLELG